jgi:iron complex outermembrane receptor protein
MQSMNRLNYIITWIFFSVTFSELKTQELVSLSGKITDEFSHPLYGASVYLPEIKRGAITDKKGNFILQVFAGKPLIISISFVGYKLKNDTLLLSSDRIINYSLKPESRIIAEVTVIGNYQHSLKSVASLPVENISKTFLKMHQSGSLMQTLGRLPGISSMDIGSGQSKPVIRGLGFNRVVVAENGVKHEAQEWGADHGLEIDQFTVERVEIIKGPASLMYGANAIGGVIDLKQISTPSLNSSGGNIQFNHQTNNDLFGVSAGFFQRKEKFYFKAHLTYSDYSDYRVPTDSIEYMSYYFRLKDNRLRNTAGLERNGSLVFGYLSNQFSSHFYLSDNFAKSGFFANAHGLEIRNSKVDFDKSDRDIDLPSQQVNHLKVLSNSIWMIEDYKINIDLGYQHNYRMEFSEPVAHGFMPVPPDSLERLYNKSTWTSMLKITLPSHSNQQITTGFNTEIQRNKIDGWGFILPEYSLISGGAFIHDNIRISEKWNINAGLRYDLGNIHTKTYYDWYQTPQMNGNPEFVQRSSEINKHFGSFSWGVGSSYQNERITFTTNAGKSFRMPTAKELSSNGINYHMYRYEKGDTTLSAEESYQLDLGVHYKRKKWDVEITPFINYFPNYIYLNPTSAYQEAQQVYYYSQSQVFRAGGEFVMNFRINNYFSFSADAEYIYSIQLSGQKKGYTLPFSPPLTNNFELIFTPPSGSFLKDPSLGIDLKMVGSQNNIVPPEKKTEGYTLLSLNGGTTLLIGKQAVILRMQLINLLNTKYFDHTSFYRLIEVPGQGRNLVVSVQLPFNVNN